MTIPVAVLAAVATINPLRLWPGLPGHDRPDRVRSAVVGAALVTVVLGGVAGVAGALLDALDISDPTARIAAGMAVAVLAVRDAFASPAAADPRLPGRWAAVVPVALPYLFAPGVTLLTVSVSADRGPGLAVVAVVPAMLSVVLAAVWAPPRGPLARACRAGQVLVAGAAFALGAALVVDGVLDI